MAVHEDDHGVQVRTFSADAASIRRARIFVADAIGMGDPELTADVQLAVSELVTNGVEHGTGTEIEVRVTVNHAVIDLVVASGLAAGSDVPRAVTEHLDGAVPALSGRGLRIVEAVSETMKLVVDGSRLHVTCSFPKTA